MNIIGKVLQALGTFDIKVSKNLKVIIEAISLLMLSLFSIMGILFLFMAIFAIIGIHLFPFIPYQLMINQQFNFQDFVKAFLVMFTVVTGYQWDILMFECAVSVTPCTNEGNMAKNYEETGVLEGCGDFFSYPFFILYILFVKLMITNLILV